MIAALKTDARRVAVEALAVADALLAVNIALDRLRHEGNPAVAGCPDFYRPRQHAGQVIDALASIAGRLAAELALMASRN
jgi:hypothetical protein